MLSYSNITYNYKNKKILSNVSLKVPKKKLTMVLGLSGAGKSTLLRLMSGRIPNDKIKLNDREISSEILKNNTALVHQHHHLPGELTVNEYFIFCYICRMPSTSSKEMQKTIDDILKNFDLFELKDQIIGHLGCNLSGGQLKRIEIGLELITNPEILFLDEPLSGLDSKNCITVLDYLKKMEKTIVATVHQPSNTVLKYFDHFIILHKRKIFFQGNYKELESYVKELGYTEQCDNYCEFVFLRVFEDLKSKNTKIKNFVYLKSNSDANSKVLIKFKSSSNRGTFFNQMKANFYRLFVQFRRNPKYGLTRFVISFLCALLISSFLILINISISGEDSDSNIKKNIMPFTFVLSLGIMLFTYLQTSMGGFFVFSRDLHLIIKEQSNNYYSLFVYFIAFSLFEVFVTISIIISPYMCCFYLVPKSFRNMIITLFFGLLPCVVSSLLSTMILSAFFVDPFIPTQFYIFLCAFDLLTGVIPYPKSLKCYEFFNVLNRMNPIFQGFSISLIPFKKSLDMAELNDLEEIIYEELPNFMSLSSVALWFSVVFVVKLTTCFIFFKWKINNLRKRI